MTWLWGCAAPRPDLLVFTFDTTRADALGAYGAAPSPSPVVDALAARGRAWDEATTPAPLTLPAHAALFTGRYPGPLGLRRNGVEAVPAEVETLAERLRAEGYATAAFVGAVVLDGSFGLAQGFDTYHDGFDVTGEEAELGLIQRWTAREVGDRAQAWLLAHAHDGPLFLWVHLYDAHLPLPAEHSGRFGGAYGDAVAAMDAEVGALLAEHAALGRPPPLVAVAGDHGESHGEHGELTHGFFTYRSTMRVPMVVAGPGIAPGRERRVASLVDLAPTLLEALGLPYDGMDGTPGGSGLAYGEAWTPRDTFGLSELRVVQDDTWRYVAAPRPELFAWRDDPAEATNRLSPPASPDPQPPAAQAAAAQARLTALVAGGPYARPETAAGPVPAQLAALGYLSGPGVSVDLADPKDFPALNEEVERLVAAARRRPPAEGVPMLEAFLRDRREVPYVRLALVRGYRALSRLPDARAALAPLLVNAPDDPQLRTMLAQLAMEGRDLAAAESTARAVLAGYPHHVPVYAILAETLRLAGRPAEAADVVQAGLERSGETTSLWLVKGVLAVDAGQVAEAIPALERVVEADPRHRDALLLLGLALGQAGRPEEAVPLLERRETLYGPSVEGTGALARALYGIGRTDALPRLAWLLEHEPARLEWRLFAADLLLRAGRTTEGRVHLDAARGMAPGDPRVAELAALFDP